MIYSLEVLKPNLCNINDSISMIPPIQIPLTPLPLNQAPHS